MSDRRIQFLVLNKDSRLLFTSYCFKGGERRRFLNIPNESHTGNEPDSPAAEDSDWPAVSLSTIFSSALDPSLLHLAWTRPPCDMNPLLEKFHLARQVTVRPSKGFFHSSLPRRLHRARTVLAQLVIGVQGQDVHR